MSVRDVRRDLPAVNQFGEQAGPLLTKHIGPGKTAVAADHNECVDAVLKHVAGGRSAALPGSELLRSGGTYGGAALVQNSVCVNWFHSPDEVTASDEALVPLVDRIHLDAAMHRGANDRTHRCVHPRRITSAGQNTDTRWC